MQPAVDDRQLSAPSGPWTDLALTVPIFVGYHLGVVFLPIRNAADVVTRELVNLADRSLGTYAALTLCIGGLYLAVLMLLGRGRALHWERFLSVIVEGVLYAVAMRLIANWVSSSLVLAPGGALAVSIAEQDAFSGTVMALGAGFYEELAFRVALFGVGGKLLLLTFPSMLPFSRIIKLLVWGLLSAAAFSAWHHLGAMGEPFELRVFVFRWVAGLVFTLIYALRGFAPVVWTHTLYDIWVLVL
jgi:hypothetical protein